ncbi:MAG TPA: response regulator [Caulobacteraceae bacterium]|nr:response regulator [Caulobacteraceae bacterium]
MAKSNKPILGEQDVIARLEARLQRERRARRKAELIAERGRRDLYQGQNVQRLVEAIAMATNQHETLQDTLAYALAQICGFMSWATGHVYWVDEDGDTLTSADLWHGMDGERELFRFSTLTIGLRRGRGLPGRVLASGEPVWVPDVTVDDNFPRARVARLCGLHAAFAFPVLVGRETAAVLEFFSLEVVQPNAAVLRAMAQIGSILGRAIERDRAQKRLLEKVAEAEAQRLAAETANLAKSNFLAVTSHEVRTPLNAVLGLAQVLSQEPLTVKQSELVGGVLEAGHMLMRLLNAVLDVSKIEAGKMSLDEDAFDLRWTAQTVVQIWSARARELGLDLKLDMEGLGGSCRLVSDPGKIEQILVNLISNAAKFSPTGGRVTVRLTAAAEQDGRQRIRVEVEDQGPGVSPEERRRIFAAFEQTDLGRKAGGAGLGLSICAGHVALLGGAIGVDDGAEGGARFWFEFLAEPAGVQPELPQTPEVTRGGAEGLRILAAEDHPVNRQVLKALLEPMGPHVSFAENGLQALEALTGSSFDLVLMDVNMPVMDGVDALKAIRRMSGPAGATPVYMLTANVFDDDVRSYLGAGADGVLKKPIDVQALHHLVEQIAQRVAPENLAASRFGAKA